MILSFLDPRSTLVAALVSTGVLMMLDRWMDLAAACGVLLMGVVLLGLLRPWLGLLKGLGFAAASFFVIAWLSFDLATGLTAALRLLSMGTIFFLFFQTTTPERLSNALVKLGMPYAFTFVFSASLQFVEVLARRAANIRDAQRARGIPLDRGWSRLRYLPALLSPLLVQAFKLGDELAEALEARGFGAPGRRFRHEPHFRWADWILLVGSLAVLVISFRLTRP